MQKRIYDKTQINKLLVVNKPIYMSSNFYLNRIKRKYKNKKAGFSGTLDPFAKGCLIVAFGQYAKLFKYLDKTPKKYKAVIWLGTTSESFDLEKIIEVKIANELKKQHIIEIIESLNGDISYTPPKFSAKKIDGVRAYERARAGEDIVLETSVMHIYENKFIQYNHPFITFEATVSEGSYIRSLAQIILEKLNQIGTLSYLERINEGKFFFDNEKELNPLDYINIPKNKYFGEKEWLIYGKKISLEFLENREEGEYIIVFDDFFSIIEIKDNEVKYLLNNITLDKIND